MVPALRWVRALLRASDVMAIHFGKRVAKVVAGLASSQVPLEDGGVPRCPAAEGTGPLLDERWIWEHDQKNNS